jgi:hypothetical protein
VIYDSGPEPVALGGSIVIHLGKAAKSVTGLGLPTEFVLENSSPNPFNPRTHIRFALPEAVTVTVEVCNIRGQKVATFVDGEAYDAGRFEVMFEADRLA